jgi:2-methylfumaryl-CoA isomerase
MVVALTGRQWTALVDVTGTAAAFQSLEGVTGHDVSSEDGRFRRTRLIAAILRPWFEARSLDEIRTASAVTGVSWGPYQTFRQLVEEDPRASERNPMFSTLEQPGIGSYLVPASPLDFSVAGRLPASRAPTLGEHTEEVLADVLGLSGAESGRLFDAETVAGAAERALTR